jgi:DNA-binding NtrC family response regulator
MQPMTMLVADKSAKIRNLFQQAVKAAGMPVTITEAASAADCKDRLAQGDVELAFVDIDLPGLAEAESVWDAGRSGRKTLMTAMCKPGNTLVFDLAENHKAFEFLIKPFRQEDALAILASYRRLEKPKKVLIVDDSPSIRQIIGRILAGSVYRLEIEEAADEATALARVQSGEVDIVFLDWDTSEPGGTAAAERLLDWGPKAKIILMSIEFTPWQERGALRRGAAAFVHKPFYPADIEELLHRLCGLDMAKVGSKAGSMVAGFEVRIHGRTVTASHVDSGNTFQFLWFRDAPYLRASRMVGKGAGTAPSEQVRTDAEKAAVAELNRAELLNLTPQALAG